MAGIFKARKYQGSDNGMFVPIIRQPDVAWEVMSQRWSSDDEIDVGFEIMRKCSHIMTVLSEMIIPVWFKEQRYHNSGKGIIILSPGPAHQSE